MAALNNSPILDFDKDTLWHIIWYLYLHKMLQFLCMFMGLYYVMYGLALLLFIFMINFPYINTIQLKLILDLYKCILTIFFNSKMVTKLLWYYRGCKELKNDINFSTIGCFNVLFRCSFCIKNSTDYIFFPFFISKPIHLSVSLIVFRVHSRQFFQKLGQTSKFLITADTKFHNFF